QLKANPFVLAPMAGITDCPFRSFMREMGASVVVTELVSATGLQFSSQKTMGLMKFEEMQRPIGIQIFGETLEHLSFAAKAVEDMGADFVDLNFGCPVPKVVKKGAGSAILKDLDQMSLVLRTVKSAVNVPVTIKIRTGWEESSKNSREVCQRAYDEGISWVGIHGRTRAQGYAGEADWNYIAEVKATSPIPVLGNGDITSAKKAVSRLKESGCDGVLIGRGCLKNPWIFRESLKLWKESQTISEERNLMDVFARLQYHLDRLCPERISLLQIKKFAAWFSAGYPDSAQFRKDLFRSQDRSEILSRIGEYFGRLEGLIAEDTSQEPFLMGGHG
ncbi:MAG: tRNA dihydrouridine synthase DusB, partial [Bdellovibrionales bacterium]|nr:tRNA dihydrouridine synthase DusB [Bdellovibrionales bacterium]